MADRTKLVTGIRDALKKFETQDFDSKSRYQTGFHYARDVLFAFYKAGVSRIPLTQEEKLQFAQLLQPALPALGCRICYIVSAFPPNGLESSKAERSGLQFLFDYFTDCTTSKTDDDDGSSIIEDLNKFREEQDVDEWDEFLKSDFVDYLDPGIGLSKYSTPDVPPHHWWFF